MWTKIKKYFDVVGKAIRQFLRYAYAAQISYLILAIFFYLFVNHFIGVVLFAWGVILLIAEIKQQKAEKT